ncbi:cation transporter [Winogradskyella flava]|uniref:HMA domain-containing protein n=1 Tax=Winogradskyella flava TaxID=1884876 RepID=A0A842ISJ3_9FLAO|nr:cation transporter [Winogradskyella flava]MBC2844397.1 hypothetical protein [Winogradskyella flava]
MNLKEQIISNARIEVQQSFCDFCSIDIKKALQEIEAIKNIRLYPKDSIVTFNFTSPHKLSTALNTLSAIGYCEKGEVVDNKNVDIRYCNCK